MWGVWLQIPGFIEVVKEHRGQDFYAISLPISKKKKLN